jgi:heme-degrading monooxygenase HmoA
MIAVIFEVEPHAEHKQAYLDIAASLRPELEQVDGFVSIERFQSLTNDNKVLSLSFFRDEDAIKQWRNLQVHREAQSAGRGKLFKDYRLRIAGVLRDYGLNEREQVPEDSLDLHAS